MSKVLVIPDSHLKISVIENGLKLASKHRADKVVLLGDYFDDWFAISQDYKDMLMYLKTLLKKNPNVIPLFGNHELSYLGYPCSGYNNAMAETLRQALYPDHRFLFGVAIDEVFYSHAGVCTGWLKENKIMTQNDLRINLFKKTGAELLEKCIGKISDISLFAHAGPARGGSKFPSPLWADLTELVADPAPVKQVVGHTPVKEIENVGKVWFTDVFSNDNECDEYLLVTDGEPQIVKYYEEEHER